MRWLDRYRGWRPIGQVPGYVKKEGIVVLVKHDHGADPYLDPAGGGKLTKYAAWVEGNGWAPRGTYLARWGGGYDEEYPEVPCHMPDWWFRADDEDHEHPLNPTHFRMVP